MPKKQGKFLNREFGPAALLADDIADFLNRCEGPPGTLAEYRQAANSLAYLVVHPDALASAEWFPPFYEAHPRFTLEFMLAMRRALASKSTGEKWLFSFEAIAGQRSKDEAVEADLGARGVKIKSRELSDARLKLRQRALRQNAKLP